MPRNEVSKYFFEFNLELSCERLGLKSDQFTSFNFTNLLLIQFSICQIERNGYNETIVCSSVVVSILFIQTIAFEMNLSHAKKFPPQKIQKMSKHLNPIENL